MLLEIEKQLRRDEGEVLHAYQDINGYWTIGIGRLIDARRGGGISREESAFLFHNDTSRIIAEMTRLLPWTLGLDDARRGVLIAMAFQMGVGGMLGFRKTLAHAQAGRYYDASKEMLDSTWARVHVSRAGRLSVQMRTGIWQ